MYTIGLIWTVMMVALTIYNYLKFYPVSDD